VVGSGQFFEELRALAEVAGRVCGLDVVHAVRAAARQRYDVVKVQIRESFDRVSTQVADPAIPIKDLAVVDLVAATASALVLAVEKRPLLRIGFSPAAVTAGVPLAPFSGALAANFGVRCVLLALLGGQFLAVLCVVVGSALTVVLSVSLSPCGHPGKLSGLVPLVVVLAVAGLAHALAVVRALAIWAHTGTLTHVGLPSSGRPRPGSVTSTRRGPYFDFS